MTTELSILLPALVLGILMMIIHVPLGQEVLKRGVVFVDLSLAQLSGMGAIFAGMAGFSPVMVQLAALGCALLGGFSFRFIEKHYKEVAEAAIGCTFVLSATLILLILSNQPHGTEHINDILSGQLLFATWDKVLLAGSVFISAAALVYLLPQIFLGKMFYILLAVVITTSVQMCGVYLVFASLIFPAVATAHIKDKKIRKIFEYIGESSGILLGLLISYYFDLPTGPAIVWAIALTTAVCGFSKKAA